jgi:hypothetical protein
VLLWQQEYADAAAASPARKTVDLSAAASIMFAIFISISA